MGVASWVSHRILIFKIYDMDNNKDQLPQHVREEKEKVQRQQIMFEEFMNDVKTNPRYKDFFKGVDESGINTFTLQYARHKVSLIEYDDLYLKLELKRANKFRDLAVDSLYVIQQKKLTTAECLWN